MEVTVASEAIIYVAHLSAPHRVQQQPCAEFVEVDCVPEVAFAVLLLGAPDCLHALPQVRVLVELDRALGVLCGAKFSISANVHTLKFLNFSQIHIKSSAEF